MTFSPFCPAMLTSSFLFLFYRRKVSFNFLKDIFPMQIIFIFTFHFAYLIISVLCFAFFLFSFFLNLSILSFFVLVLSQKSLQFIPNHDVKGQKFYIQNSVCSLTQIRIKSPQFQTGLIGFTEIPRWAFKIILTLSLLWKSSSSKDQN